MNTAILKEQICAAFCRELAVREVPAGLVISGAFEGDDGDPLRCYARQVSGGWRLEDDGSFLANLDASGINVLEGERARFLQRALATADAYVEAETLQMVADAAGQDLDPQAVIAFLSAISRARDVSFWTQERVRSTFKVDALAALVVALGGAAELDERGILAGHADIRADVVVRPRPGRQGYTTAVFLAQGMEALTEALLLRYALTVKEPAEPRVAALVERDKVTLSGRKAMRAINQLDGFAIYDPDEPDALFRIARTAIPDLVRVGQLVERP